MPWIPAGAVSDDAATRRIDSPAGPILVIALEPGRRDWVAIEDRCSHADCPFSSDGALELAPDGTGGRAICDCHGSEFDLRTGAVLRGPADRPIAVFPVAERDGRLEVEVPG